MSKESLVSKRLREMNNDNSNMNGLFVTINDDNETTEYTEVLKSLSKDQIKIILDEKFGVNGWLAWNWA